MILDKQNMTEEDIKLNFITPAINASGWRNGYNITMETKITDGKINIRGNMAYREKAKKVDYLLYLNKYYPIAVVEAKDNNHSVSYGLQQAMTYAQMLELPFALADPALKKSSSLVSLAVPATFCETSGSSTL